MLHFNWTSTVRMVKGWMLPLLLAVLVLNACQAADAPSHVPPTATTHSLTTLADLQRSGASSAERSVATFGYVLLDHDDVRLVDTIIVDHAGAPQPLDTGAEPVWLGADVRAQLQGIVRSSADTQYAPVIVQGRLRGPDSYGPGGRYRYQLLGPQLSPLAAQEMSVAELLQHSAQYERRLVRLAGGLLVRENSTLLIDRIGAGGLPAPKAQQIKLRAPIADRRVLARLTSTPSGAVRFGSVQVEGLWNGGLLSLLSISIVS